MGDREIVCQLPASVSPEAMCLAGLRELEYSYIEKRVEELGLTHYSPQQLSGTSQPVINWLKKSGKSKVMIYFDTDVMAPSDILAAVADGPERGLN